MRANIIRIGNSQGVRIPKVLLEQSQLGTEVDLEVEGERIIITPVSRPRQGWEDKFRALAGHDDSSFVEEDFSGQTDWEKDEWVW